MDDITITYLGQEVTISGLRCEGLERKNRYLILAEKAEKKFLQKYYDKYGDFFAFTNKYAEDVSDFLNPYYKSMVHELVECGIYDASVDIIFQKYGEFLISSLLELQNGIKDLCNRASEGMETAMAVRELRKATRTQMVGGGFGVTGALAGMAVSGAYNTVSGLLHSGANAIGNSRMRLKINEKFQNIYKSSEFRGLVGKCIGDSVYSIKYVIEDCIGHVEVIPDSEYRSRAKALRSNFPRIPKDARQEVAQEILQLAPDDLETYKLLLPLYGDFGGGLRYIVQKVASFMLPEFDGLRQEVFQRKAYTIFEDFEKALQFQLSDVISDNDLEIIQSRAEKRIVWNAATLGYSLQDTIVSSEIYAIQNRIVQLKTVNGVVYDTIILAQKALRNRKACDDLWPSGENELNCFLLRNALQKVQDLNKEVPEGAVSDYIVMFSQQLKKADRHRKEELESNIETIFLDLKKSIDKLGVNDLNKQAEEKMRERTEKRIFTVAESFGFSSTDSVTSQAIQRITPQVERLCAEREKFFRTVEGITYNTVELAEKARANRRDGGKLVQACDTTANIDIRWVLQRLQQINHLDPIGSVSDYVDEILSKFFDRKDTNNFTFRGLIFQSIIERQEVECDFVILVTKHMSNAPTSQSLARLRSELETIPSASPLYRSISLYIQEVEQALQIQQEKEQVRLEEEKKRLSAVRRYRLKSLAEICFGTIFLYTLINVPLIVIGENPCTFPAIVDIVAGSIDFSENVHLLGYPALLLIHIGFGIGIIKEMLKSVKTMFEGGVNQSEVCGYIAWTCIAIIAISMIGGAFYHCERYVYWWLVASIIGYICVDSHK